MNGNFDDPIPNGSSDWHRLFFCALYGGRRLIKQTKQTKQTQMTNTSKKNDSKSMPAY